MMNKMRVRALLAVSFTLLLSACFDVEAPNGDLYVKTNPAAPRPIPVGRYQVCTMTNGKQKCSISTISYAQNGDLELKALEKTGANGYYAFRAANIGRVGWWLVHSNSGMDLLEIASPGRWKFYHSQCKGLKLSDFVNLYNAGAFAFKGYEKYGTELCILRRKGLTDKKLFDILMMADPEVRTISAVS